MYTTYRGQKSLLAVWNVRNCTKYVFYAFLPYSVYIIEYLESKNALVLFEMFYVFWKCPLSCFCSVESVFSSVWKCACSVKKNLFRFKTCFLSVSKCTLSVLKMSFSVWNVFFACPTMSFVHLLLMVRKAAPDLVSKGGYPPGGLLLSLLTVGQRESFRSHHASK